MNALQFNKWAGSILGALLVFFGARVLVHEGLEIEKPEKPGYQIAVPEEAAPASTEAAAPAAPAVPLPQLLAAANAEAGQKSAKVCVTCHAFEKGAPNKTGPGLYGVVGRKIASHEGFAYSKALQEKGGDWSFDNLNAFLTSPKAFAPNTKMTFAGIAKPEDRANVIAYLRSLADTPVPLPQ